MFRSMRINNCLFDKSRFWQGFPGENRLKSHRESYAATASGFLQTAVSKANSEVQADRTVAPVRFRYSSNVYG